MTATKEIAAQVGVEGWPEGAIEPLELAPNQIKLDQKLVDKAVVAPKTSSMRVDVRQGPFETVSTVTASRATAENYYFTHHAVADNMQGFGAAYSCKFFGVPLLELRYDFGVIIHEGRFTYQGYGLCQLHGLPVNPQISQLLLYNPPFFVLFAIQLNRFQGSDHEYSIYIGKGHIPIRE
ncbi:MAG TPA: hypothetical protein ENG73_05655 [Desulfobacterales bacterium]|nr:hypothetical protein [Desulfobacterales bacterium]